MFIGLSIEGPFPAEKVRNLLKYQKKWGSFNIYEKEEMNISLFD